MTAAGFDAADAQEGSRSIPNISNETKTCRITRHPFQKQIAKAPNAMERRRSVRERYRRRRMFVQSVLDRTKKLKYHVP